VKLCGSDTDNLSEMHRLPGVFVMYNYARLASLLAHFDAAVKQGMLPVAGVLYNCLRLCGVGEFCVINMIHVCVSCKCIQLHTLVIGMVKIVCFRHLSCHAQSVGYGLWCVD